MPPSDEEAALHAELLAAHARHDGRALIGLYTRAADLREAADQTAAADFYLTHAYVYALERGDARAPSLHARLLARGKEE